MGNGIMKRPELKPQFFEGKIDKLVEECGEVLQAIGKYRRHGAFVTDPSDSTKHYNNIKSLEVELHDLQDAIVELLNEQDMFVAGRIMAVQTCAR